MSPLDQLFSDVDRNAVNQAVQAAESLTSAEIVPVVATVSGRYDRPEDIVGLWGALIALTAVWLVYPTPHAEPGAWDQHHAGWQWAVFVIAVIAGFIGGTWLGMRSGRLRRLFTPRVQMQSEVDARARAIFFDRRIHHTAGASGVLLYVSLFERMAAVVADETVINALGEDQIPVLCAAFTRRLQSAHPAAALCDTIQAMGVALSARLPRSADDVNELPDALLLLE